MEAVIDEALKQITGNGYERTIKSGYEKIISCMITFFRKSAKIKKL